MKIEPVYVVAPHPEEGSRRRFLGLSLAFTVGLLGGGGAGMAVGSWFHGESPEPFDPELEQLLRLALEAPPEELLKAAPYFLYNLQRNYAGNLDVWRGFDRLVEQLVDGPLDSRQRDIALIALDLLEHCSEEGALARSHWLPLLRRRR